MTILNDKNQISNDRPFPVIKTKRGWKTESKALKQWIFETNFHENYSILGEIIPSSKFIDCTDILKIVMTLKLINSYENYCSFYGINNRSSDIKCSDIKYLNHVPYINWDFLFRYPKQDGKKWTGEIDLGPGFALLLLMDYSGFCIKFDNTPYISINGLRSLVENPINLEQKVREKDPIQTYLMQDTVRKFYKIGKSSNPRHREKTLQAEVPSIRIIHLIQKDIERLLHKKFIKKRIRGEWFSLTDEDVKYIQLLS